MDVSVFIRAVSKCPRLRGGMLSVLESIQAEIGWLGSDLSFLLCRETGEKDVLCLAGGKLAAAIDEKYLQI